ncbi:ATP synthase F0 subunit 8 (mitochondrion) [Amyelois transitella]|uniref:ATP synthase complex subunit 8 n=1 Tax=Amyelois transitella TaxID=680683 RepID=A0A0S1RRQ2_AMYTR|nr:ATP synthase F0 subunit 8 [Amyelois transitella]ALL97428.1 ATP synthase F0 subunit 8 [Amyelois transitella]
MPQMMPINWLMSFFFFIIIFIIFNMMNYYIFDVKMKSSMTKNNFFTKNFSWKW